MTTLSRWTCPGVFPVFFLSLGDRPWPVANLVDGPSVFPGADNPTLPPHGILAEADNPTLPPHGILAGADNPTLPPPLPLTVF